MQVRDYMTPAPFTIERGADYKQAFPLIQQHDLHHLPIVDDANAVIGILAQRDLQMAAKHYREAPVEVEDIMRTPVQSISPDADIVEAADRLISETIGCLVVNDSEGSLVGIITERDLHRALRDLLKRNR